VRGLVLFRIFGFARRSLIVVVVGHRLEAVVVVVTLFELALVPIRVTSAAFAVKKLAEIRHHWRSNPLEALHQ
jgi:hypothetical protein